MTAGALNDRADDDFLLIAYQDGNAYLFLATTTTGNTALATIGTNEDIVLVGVLEGVAVGALGFADFG